MSDEPKREPEDNNNQGIGKGHPFVKAPSHCCYCRSCHEPFNFIPFQAAAAAEEEEPVTWTWRASQRERGLNDNYHVPIRRTYCPVCIHFIHFLFIYLLDMVVVGESKVKLRKSQRQRKKERRRRRRRCHLLLLIIDTT